MTDVISISYEVDPTYDNSLAEERLREAVDKILLAGNFDLEALKFILLTEKIMNGSVSLRISGFDYGESRVSSIPLYAINIMNVIIKTATFDEEGKYKFEESSTWLSFKSSHKLCEVSLRRNNKLLARDEVDMISLQRKIGSFYQNTLTELMDRHARLQKISLLTNHFPLSI